MDCKKLNYEALKRVYQEYFSLSYFNTDSQQKMALIFLVCYITDKMKAKKPDASCWSVLYSLNKDIHIPESTLMGLSIVCEDYFNAGGEFPTFGLAPGEIIPKIKEILKTFLPF